MSEQNSISQELIDELNQSRNELEEDIKKDTEGQIDVPMKVIYSEKGGDNPFGAQPKTAEGMKAYSGDYHGAFSLEKFASAGSLRYTHEDAGGWLNYLQKFHPRNFWYKDRNVRIWAYYEQYDNWQDTYGLDAVLAGYHSGHGGMTGNGRFHVPLGSDWGGQGTTAWSNQMRLGNEQVRYLFWSTCLSLRVLNGHNPIRTWSPANLGFRMLFGYETVSYDNPNYGKAFWKHWNKNKSFSKAFMDASWYDISRRQAPSVVACGATKEEAKNRVFNERKLYWQAVSRNWWYWRWYNAARSATTARASNHELPNEILIAELTPQKVDGKYVRDCMMRHNVGLRIPREVKASPEGVFAIQDGDVSAAFEADGSYEFQLARPNTENVDQISTHKALDIANNFVRYYNLDKDELMFDNIMHSFEGGGSEKGSGQIEGPHITETTIQFCQTINGLPVLLPGKGDVSITIDNDGTVTNVKNSTRTIRRLTNKLRNNPSAPDEDRPIEGIPNPEQLLAEAWQESMREWVVKGGMPTGFNVVPGTYEIGYAIKGNEAFLVARKDVEVDCGGGYLKRYTIEVPLFE